MLRIGAFGRPLAHVWPITKSISSIFFRHSKQADTQGGRLRAYNQGDSVVPPSLPYQTIPYHTILASIIPYHTTHTTIPNHMHHTIPQDYTIHTPLYHTTPHPTIPAHPPPTRAIYVGHEFRATCRGAASKGESPRSLLLIYFHFLSHNSPSLYLYFTFTFETDEQPNQIRCVEIVIHYDKILLFSPSVFCWKYNLILL